ncbi:hypothetical protein P154DRAFT_258799 [Amniculicola lignicola CBS 123094]|uniref:Uncharacterized protein n=1 Tax=Amniculicola lignicola CBS 123094 TaxID=1392246 RepID=A0A6A5WZ12_9PLEO|nr:hypothetical protein P154DRAFT_258799 [Amniculicola lignicola CBS 123094]
MDSGHSSAIGTDNEDEWEDHDEAVAEAQEREVTAAEHFYNCCVTTNAKSLCLCVKQTSKGPLDNSIELSILQFNCLSSCPYSSITALGRRISSTLQRIPRPRLTGIRKPSRSSPTSNATLHIISVPPDHKPSHALMLFRLSRRNIVLRFVRHITWREG